MLFTDAARHTIKKGKNVITTKCRIVRGELDGQAGGLESWQGAHPGF